MGTQMVGYGFMGGSSGPAGPPGPQGNPGSTSPVSAAQNLPAYKAVTVNGEVANSSNPLHRLKVIGVTDEQINTGFVGNILSAGQITNPLWNWQLGDLIFINQDELSNVAPDQSNSVWCQQVGVAIGPHTIIIQLKQSYLL